MIKLCRLDDCSQTVGRNDPDAKLHAVVLDGLITLTNEEDDQILIAIGEYGTAFREELVILDDVTVPQGLLNSEESTQYNTTQQQMVKTDEPSTPGISVWAWIIGIILIVVGL